MDAKRFLDTCDADNKTTKEQKIDKINSFISDLLGITQVMASYKNTDLWSVLEPKIGKPMQDLYDLKPLLDEKIVMIKENSTKNDSQNKENPSSSSSNSDIKNQMVNSNDKSMDMDELIGYKTKLCPNGQTCPFAPKLMLTKPPKFGDFDEYMCSYWHNDVDRRRELCDDK